MDAIITFAPSMEHQFARLARETGYDEAFLKLCWQECIDDGVDDVETWCCFVESALEQDL